MTFIDAADQSKSFARAWGDLTEGFRKHELWLHLGWQDIKQKYRRSVLGPFWITIATGTTVRGRAIGTRDRSGARSTLQTRVTAVTTDAAGDQTTYGRIPVGAVATDTASTGVAAIAGLTAGRIAAGTTGTTIATIGAQDLGD